MDQTERNVEIIRNRIEEAKDAIRADLEAWIATLPSPQHVPLTAALLEAAIDRNLRLVGADVTRQLIHDTLDRQAEQFRRSLS
jgi:hypothetical protein